MTDQKPVKDNASCSDSNGSGNAECSGTNDATSVVSHNEDKHVVRILGSYSLLSFFTRTAQDKFFEITTSPEFEAIFSFSGEYAERTDSFELDVNEKEFELRMTNLGFTREAFWKEAFPPIFRLRQPTADWYHFLPRDTQEQLDIAWNQGDKTKCEFTEALLYRYSLCKLGEELRKVGEQDGALKIHIGPNKFGIANIGITIELQKLEHEYFQDLCKKAYAKVAHLQEDPLQD